MQEELQLRLYQLHDELIPPAYVIELRRRESLDLAGDDRTVVEELLQQQRMTELRVLAMELYANFSPTDERGRRDFVREYFASTGPEALEQLFDRFAKQITEDLSQEHQLSRAIQAILSKTRQAAFDDHMQRFRGDIGTPPEEPNQLKVIEWPYDRHLLVNAGPGAGKTTVLMMRVAHLIHVQQLRPEQILILAFNRAVVYEIRRRIGELFRELGYPGYVRRLRIYTFHGLARRYHPSDEDSDKVIQDQKTMDELLERFSHHCQFDQEFAATVAQGASTILVDEFQDMTENFYGLIRALQHASGASITVIGDDDQDILGWQRVKKTSQPADRSAQPFFAKFSEDFHDNGQSPDVINLSVNFRSGKKIIERSQDLIQKVLVERHEFSRQKQHQQLRPCSKPPDAQVECYSKKENFDRLFKKSLDCAREWLAESIQAGESIALLCRNNAEVASVYHALSDQFSELAVQQTLRLRLSRERAIWEWRLTVQQSGEVKEQRLSRELFYRLRRHFQESGVPEALNTRVSIYDLRYLWKACLVEHPYATLQDFLDFLDDLSCDDYPRIAAISQPCPARLVSTIHKVKGLEFDRVIIFPSQMRFSTDQSRCRAEAAEEVRLYYVAMTRAKSYLAYFLGPREHKWIAGEIFEPPKKGCRIRIIGSGTEADAESVFEEINLSYAARPGTNQQDHIRQRVKIDDVIELRSNGNFYHEGKSIGCLSKKMYENIGGLSGPLQVRSVYAYPQKEDSAHSSRLAEPYRQRGWSYVVIPKGVLSRNS